MPNSMDQDQSKLKELFFDNSCSLKNLLAEAKRSQLNLSQLRNSLIQYQQDFNQNLLDLFDNNYDQFYKLSHIITCLNQPIQVLHEPLESFRVKLSGLCQKHDSYIDEINQKLSAIEDNCKNKELASRFINLIQIRDRIEKQIKSVDWKAFVVKEQNYYSIANNPRRSLRVDQELEYKITCDLKERLNNELFYLNCQINSIKPTNDELIFIKKSLQSSIDKLIKQLNFNFHDDTPTESQVQQQLSATAPLPSSTATSNTTTCTTTRAPIPLAGVSKTVNHDYLNPDDKSKTMLFDWAGQISINNILKSFKR